MASTSDDVTVSTNKHGESVVTSDVKESKDDNPCAEALQRAAIYKQHLYSFLDEPDRSQNVPQLPQCQELWYSCGMCGRWINTWTFNIPVRNVIRSCKDSVFLSWKRTCHGQQISDVAEPHYNGRHMIDEYETEWDTYQLMPVKNVLSWCQLMDHKTKEELNETCNFLRYAKGVFVKQSKHKMNVVAQKSGVQTSKLNRIPFDIGNEIVYLYLRLCEY